MTVALRQPMTLAEFLAWEERQELRSEFDQFQPAAMTGGACEHEVIGGNVQPALQNRLGAGRCQEQNAIAAVVCVREGTDLIVETLATDDTLRIPEIGIEVPMAEFYVGIDLPDEAAAQAE